MSGFYPENTNLGVELQTDVVGHRVDKGYIAHETWSAAEAAAADTNAVHAAVTDTGSQQVVTTGITNPPAPRNITATSGGVAGDIKAIQVVIQGTDVNDEVISETLPVFTENSATTVVGSKAFKTVTSITIPAHDGNGATTEVGFGDKLGLYDKLSANTVLAAALNGVREGTAPTVAVSASAISGNTVDLNSTLDGTAVDVWYVS